MEDNEQYLRRLYYGIDSPTAYTGKVSLWRQIKNDNKDKEITREDLQRWLELQYTYTLHKPYKKPSAYKRTITSAVDDQWQADLVEMREFSEANEGYNYMLCVIDCFSKFAWVEALKTKTGREVSEAFEKIFEKGRVPTKMQFDEGKEFYNEHVKSILTDQNIKHFSTHSVQKASIIERWNRTLKTRMWKYFTANETRKWIDIVQNLVNDYNNSFHRTIQMTPVEASNPENTQKVWHNMYNPQLIHKFGLPKFRTGQTVRISKYKRTFDKGYLPNFTEEFFKIKDVVIGLPVVYKIEDLKNESVDGIFYEDELSPYTVTGDTEYKVEKVLATKKVKGHQFYLVKYKGWPDKFNEWLPAENVTNK